MCKIDFFTINTSQKVYHEQLQLSCPRQRGGHIGIMHSIDSSIYELKPFHPFNILQFSQGIFYKLFCKSRPRFHNTWEMCGVTTKRKISMPRHKEIGGTTYLVNPGVNSTSGEISFPLSSTALLISSVASIVTITIHTLASAKCRPGHILFMSTAAPPNQSKKK